MALLPYSDEGDREKDALRIENEATTELEHAFVMFSSSRKDESDESPNAESPFLDSFYEPGGRGAIMRMFEFTLAELVRFFGIIQPHVSTTWNVDCTQRWQQKPLCVLFMPLTVLKYRGSWESLAHIFRMRVLTFMRLIRVL